MIVVVFYLFSSLRKLTNSYYVSSNFYVVICENLYTLLIKISHTKNERERETAAIAAEEKMGAGLKL